MPVERSDDAWRSLRRARWAMIGAVSVWFVIVVTLGIFQPRLPTWTIVVFGDSFVIGLLAFWFRLNVTSRCPKCGQVFGRRGVFFHGPFGPRCRWCGIRFGARVGKDRAATAARYRIESSEVVALGDDGAARWRRLVDGEAAVEVVALDGAEKGCVVLLDPEARRANRFRNVVCLNAAGEIEWRGALPDATESDCYVSLRRAESGVVAHSWSGYLVRFDLADGSLIERSFVK